MTRNRRIGSFAIAKLQAKSQSLLAIIAILAIIGFSMTACDLDGNNEGTNPGGLAAPVLTAEAISSTEINLYWTAIAGAAGYNLYGSLSSSSGFQLLGTRTTNSAGHSGITSPPGTTIYYRVAAYSSNGTEGAMSNTASATTLSAGSYSLNGIWSTSSGYQVSISGSTGIVSSFGTPSAITQDAINKGYVKLGDQDLRNLTSTGNLTWSGQILVFSSNQASPNVATGTSWVSCNITMSANGQTIDIQFTTSFGNQIWTYTRRR